MPDPADLTTREDAAALASVSTFSVELTMAVLARMDQIGAMVHAYARGRHAVMDAVVDADQGRRRRDAASPLLVVPVDVKDLRHTFDAPTEADSRVLSGLRPARDATAVARLRKVGAVNVEKTVTHELAYGFNEPPIRDLPDVDCNPGDSSAGSAVAVEVGSAIAAIGNMTGLPALIIPCGFAGGLPVGLNLVGRPLDEATILTSGQAHPDSAGWLTTPVNSSSGRYSSDH